MNRRERRHSGPGLNCAQARLSDRNWRDTQSNSSQRDRLISRLVYCVDRTRVGIATLVCNADMRSLAEMSELLIRHCHLGGVQKSLGCANFHTDAIRKSKGLSPRRCRCLHHSPAFGPPTGRRHIAIKNDFAINVLMWPAIRPACAHLTWAFCTVTKS